MSKKNIFLDSLAEFLNYAKIENLQSSSESLERFHYGLSAVLRESHELENEDITSLHIHYPEFLRET